MKVKRYWIKFKASSGDPFSLVRRYGCGVTAYDFEDAMRIIREQIFEGGALPEIELVIEDVDVSTLDEGHVLPNMELPFRRGIWFPRGYQL